MQEIYIDIETGSIKVMEAVEQDNANKAYKLIVIENKERFDLTNKTVKFAFKRFGDSEGDIIDLPITNVAKGEMEFKIDKRITKKDGVYICQLAISGADNYLKHTGYFKLLIDENLFNSISDELMSDEEFKKLNSMINQGNTLKSEMPGLIDNMNKIKSDLNSNIDKLNDTYKKIEDTKGLIDKANSLKDELEQGVSGVDSKNAELQKNLKAVEDYMSTLDRSTNLHKMRSDIDKNILRIDQHTRDITKINADIKDIKENGVIGGGGGNNTAPTITTDFNKKIFTVDDAIVIPYFVVDGEGGQMKAFYTLNDVQQKPVIVELGSNKWEVGKLAKGSYKLKIYVTDRGGLFSNQLIFDIQVGALEITSNFNDKIDYKLNEEIIIGYNISSMGKQLVNLKTTIDGAETTKQVKIGFNNLNLGIMGKGIHKVSLQALYDNVVSNVLSFSIVVTDSTTLFLSTSFDGKGLTNADYVSIPYRISLQGQKQFIVHASVNDINKPTLEGILGVNQLQLGYLDPGLYTIKIYATTMNGGQTSNTLTFQLNIAQSDFKLAEYVKDGLLLDLSAIGKTNASMDKIEWIDKSPYKRKVSLNGFNFEQNGWIDDSLVINGEANAEFDITPFAENCPKGVTIEMYLKYKENSEQECNFAQCYSSNGTGFYINDEYTYLNSTVDSIKYPLESDEFIHVAYVIDWNTKFEYIYINGCISAATLLYDTTDFTSTEKLKIGACIPDTLVDCSFKYVRVYDRALNHSEILTNFTSCHDIEEQKDIVKRNGENALPEMNIQGDFDGMGKDLPVKLKIDFRSKGLAGSDFSLPACNVEWQGDSTLQYAVKNYSIKLYQESGDKYNVQPKTTWPKTNRVWTKANMMDSSGATSAGVGHMFAAIYKEKTPPMMDKRSSLYTVDSFPMLMYHNDRFAGVYTWMLPPKANPLGLDYDKPFNYNFGCEENAGNGIGAFNLKDSIGDGKIPTKEQILNGWSCYSDTDGNAFSHFATLLKWVNDCYWSGTDNYTKFPQFREKAAKKFNLSFLIDYWIYCQVFGLVDSLGKNLQLYSFGTMNDEGEPIWYTTFFDFDTGLGCDNKGEFIWPPDMNCPEDYNTPHNLLWEMVRNEFKEEIKARYIEMRRSNLTTKKFKEVFYDNFIHTIGEKYYNMDALNKYFVWGSGYIQMFHGNKWLELRKWFRERLVYLDTMYSYTGDLKHTIVLRNTHPGQVEFNVKVESPQFITTSFGGAEGANDGNVVTKKCTEDNYTTFRYSYNGSYQKDAYITSASQIIDLKGLAGTDLIMLDVQYANKLIGLNIDNNPMLTAAHFDNCTNLEAFSARNCKALTSVLNFNNSKNLKTIDISGSGVQGIIFDKCMNLETLNITGSGIKSFVSNGIIKTLDLSENSKLANIRCLNDNKIFEIKNITSMKSEQLVDFVIDGCENLNNLSLERHDGNTRTTGKMLNLTVKNKDNFKVNFEWDSVNLNFDNIKNLNIEGYDNSMVANSIDNLIINNVENLIIDGNAYNKIKLKNLILKTIPITMTINSNGSELYNCILKDFTITNDTFNNIGIRYNNLIFDNCTFDTNDSYFYVNRDNLKSYFFRFDSNINENLTYIIYDRCTATFANLNNKIVKTSGTGTVKFENCKNVTWIKDGTIIINN